MDWTVALLCVCHFNRKNQSGGITQDKTSGKRPDALVESPGLVFLGLLWGPGTFNAHVSA
eukprot:scaffold97975_cov60-Attheya_sp.AAC.1